MSVESVGEGAWSRCYGYRQGDDDLVIRFGKYVDDFQKDQRAFAYAGPGLPIPEVLDIGQAFDGYYAISRRLYGVPLESLDAAQLARHHSVAGRRAGGHAHGQSVGHTGRWRLGCGWRRTMRHLV